MHKKFLNCRVATADWCREMGLVAQAKVCNQCSQPMSWDQGGGSSEDSVVGAQGAATKRL
jgi:hypothetical protein